MKKVLMLLSDGFEEIEALGVVDILRQMCIRDRVWAADRRAAASDAGFLWRSSFVLPESA